MRAGGGSAFEYARPGTLETASTDEQAQALQRTAKALRGAGVRAAWLDREAAIALEPMLGERIIGGLAKQLRSNLERKLGRYSVDLPVFPDS